MPGTTLAVTRDPTGCRTACGCQERTLRPDASRTVCRTNAPWYSTAVTTPSPARRLATAPRGTQRDLVRTQDHLHVGVDAAPARQGRDDADLAGEQCVVDVGGQEVGVAHE